MRFLRWKKLPSQEKQSANILQPNEQLMTKKELFDELYQQYLYLKKCVRREKLIIALRHIKISYFIF